MAQQKWTQPVTSEVTIDDDDVSLTLRKNVDMPGWTVTMDIRSTIGGGTVDAALANCGLTDEERAAFKQTAKKVRDYLLTQAGYTKQA